MSRIPCYENMPWVDLFSGPHFEGELVRLYPDQKDNGASAVKKQLPKFGSIIVGPNVQAKVYLQGKARPIVLRANTVLPLASSRLNGSDVSQLILVPA
jgi:hypothetical protein